MKGVLVQYQISTNFGYNQNNVTMETLMKFSNGVECMVYDGVPQRCRVAHVLSSQRERSLGIGTPASPIAFITLPVV